MDVTGQEAAAERARQARAVAHRAVTEGVNVKYVEVMRRELYSLADDYDALAAALSAAQDALRWLDGYLEQDGAAAPLPHTTARRRIAAALASSPADAETRTCLKCGAKAVRPHGGGYQCRDCGALAADTEQG